MLANNVTNKKKAFDWINFEVTSFCRFHKIMPEKKVNEAVEKYLEGMKLRNICKALPNAPERTTSCLAMKKRDGIETKRPGPLLTLSVE
jgi:hypothetical protein